MTGEKISIEAQHYITTGHDYKANGYKYSLNIMKSSYKNSYGSKIQLMQ